MRIAKPYRGRISNWSTRPCSPNEGLGYYIVGLFLDHSEFKGLYGHTSWIVSHNEETGEIETRNSRYTLVSERLKERD